MIEIFERHYHVELLSKEFRLPVYIIKSRKEAEAKYEEIIAFLLEKTGGKVKFHGSHISSVGSTAPEHYVTVGPCVKNCLQEVKE